MIQVRIPILSTARFQPRNTVGGGKQLPYSQRHEPVSARPAFGILTTPLMTDLSNVYNVYQDHGICPYVMENNPVQEMTPDEIRQDFRTAELVVMRTDRNRRLPAYYRSHNLKLDIVIDETPTQHGSVVGNHLDIWDFRFPRREPNHIRLPIKGGHWVNRRQRSA